MKTITIKTYQFSELPDEGKKKAIELMRDINTDFNDWNEPILEGAKEELETLGYTDIKIMFSGFGSQGDGACFEASVDIKAWLKAHKLSNKYKTLYSNADNGTISISQSGHYYHEKSMVVSEDFYNESDKLMSQVDAVVELIEGDIVERAKKIYKDLETYYFELMEDEAVIDTIEANEYEFLVDGTRTYPI